MKKRLVLFSAFLSIVMFFASIGGTFATWFLAEEKPTPDGKDLMFDLTEFIYVPEEMPKEEVSVVQRLSDILNKKYTTEKINDSLDYLLNETIQVFWGGNIYADPYVGSMDVNFEEQIDELFRDVLFETNVSFILKNQDLNGDGYREITMYSTSDPLDCAVEFDGVVCVYVTVFTPRVDERKNVIGYTLVCESLRGYCYEVYYGQGDTTPSFSTDEWKDDIGYWHYFNGWAERVPEGEMNADGTLPYRLDYYSYNKSYKYVYDGYDNWGATLPYGNRLGQCLYNKIPWIG